MASQEDNASWISRLLLLYLNPLIALGANKSLLHDDLGEVSEKDKSAVLRARFDVEWDLETKKPQEKRSLWLALWRTVGYHRVFTAMFVYGLYAAISYGPILILKVLIRYFSGAQSLTPTALWVLVAMMLVLPCIGSVCAAQSNVIFAHISVQVRNILVNKIYRKSLKLSGYSKQKTSTGQIINMFSADTAMLQRALNMLNNTVTSPMQIIACLVLIYRQVGVAMFVGLGLLLLMIPLNASIFFMVHRLRRSKMVKTDARVKLMNEILAGIRVLKFYAWEKSFEGKINDVRGEELAILTHIAYAVGIGFTLVMSAAPAVLPVLIFYTYTKLGNRLDAATAFTTISLFNSLQFPFAFLPMGLSQYSQSKVSVKRILNFFQLEELDVYVKADSVDDSVILMDHAYLSWILGENVDQIVQNKDTEPKDGKIPIDESNKRSDNYIGGVNRSLNTLEDITFTVKKGELVAIVGSVGSGKSSLLSALLGELNKHSGDVLLSGSVAYCVSLISTYIN